MDQELARKHLNEIAKNLPISKDFIEILAQCEIVYLKKEVENEKEVHKKGSL